MTIELRNADFGDERLLAFLESYLDELAPTAPIESQHALDVNGLQERPGVRLFVAYETSDGAVVGTGALAALEPGHEELKSMRTDPSRRGAGIGTAILTHLLADARARDIERISLETGSMSFFDPARALYAKAGFEACGPYGDYIDDPNSYFMTRTL
ncbi:GNAT family N-acetyltransferase [Leifsonia sp. NPDC058292]|uniref:GNAT family N-acetyltransferase n=1 Tax=Leifsonia sp. NPDC058292 TaxID=3346428 RepID=UPI0036DBB063